MADQFEQSALMIKDDLKGKLSARDISKIWLNSTREQLFSPKASILNRLIVAWLKVENRFEILPHSGWIATDPDGNQEPGGREKAEIPPGVRHTILRHGPRKETKF